MTIALLLEPHFRTTTMWLDELRATLREEPVELLTEATDRGAVDIVLVRGVDPGDLRVFPALGLIQCLWAGVDRLIDDQLVPDRPLLARTVDPAMADQMATTAVAHVLDVALGHHRYRLAQQEGVWKPRHCKPMSTKTVGVLGFGSLGRRCAEMLSPFGFSLIGLRSTRPRADHEDSDLAATATSLDEVLAASDIVVNLLPLTPDTEGILNAQAFSVMRPGAALVNLGRGRHVVDDDLLAALDGGHLSRAVLDVFRSEPLDVSHRYWTHPLVTVTPHIAAETDPRSAAPVLVANIRAYRRGDHGSITGLVDRQQGY